LNVSDGIITIPISKDEYILVNTYTGAVDSVDGDVVRVLGEIRREGTLRSTKISKNIIDRFVQRGYLTEHTFEEDMSALEELFRANYDHQQKCKNHRVVVTYDCNLRCKYCYEARLKDHGSRWLQRVFTEDQVVALFDAVSYLDSNCDMKYRMITLYGGEPFLPQNIEIVKYLMRKGMKRGYRFFAVTNGVSLKDYASELKKEGLDGVQITLDGLREVHDKRRFKADGTGTFDEIVQSIEEARKVGLRTIALRITFDPSNFHELTSLLEFMVGRGWDQDKSLMIYLAKVWESPGSEYSSIMPWDEAVLSMIKLVASNERFQFLVRGLTDINPIGKLFFTGQWYPLFHGCEATCNCVFYDPYGDMYACWEAIGQKEHVIGRFLPRVKFNENHKLWLERNVFSMPVCRKCKYKALCGGGCAIRAYYKTGSLMSPNCLGIQNYIDKYIASLYRVSRKMKKAQSRSLSLSVHRLQPR